MSGGHFFSPWESPLHPGRIRYGCGRDVRALLEQAKGIPLVFFRKSERKCKRVPSGVQQKRLFWELSVSCGTISTPSVCEAMLRIVKCLGREWHT